MPVRNGSLIQDLPETDQIASLLSDLIPDGNLIAPSRALAALPSWDFETPAAPTPALPEPALPAPPAPEPAAPEPWAAEPSVPAPWAPAPEPAPEPAPQHPALGSALSLGDLMDWGGAPAPASSVEPAPAPLAAQPRAAEPAAHPGMEPLGVFLAGVNWRNEPRQAPQRSNPEPEPEDAAETPLGSWPLGRFLAGVNWTNKAGAVVEPRPALRKPLTLDDLLADFVW